MAAQFVQALLAPGQVLGFLVGGGQQGALCFRIARGERLASIKRLRAHLAAMIDTHEAGGMALLGRVQLGVGQIGIRVRAARPGLGEDRAQRLVELKDEGVGGG